MKRLLCAFCSQIFFLLTTYKAIIEYDMWTLFSKTDLEGKASKIFPSHTANTKAILLKYIVIEVLEKRIN